MYKLKVYGSEVRTGLGSTETEPKRSFGGIWERGRSHGIGLGWFKRCWLSLNFYSALMRRGVVIQTKWSSIAVQTVHDCPQRTHCWRRSIPNYRICRSSLVALKLFSVQEMDDQRELIARTLVAASSESVVARLSSTKYAARHVGCSRQKRV